MKANKLLILIAALSMCLAGCNRAKQDTSGDASSESSSKTTSSESEEPEDEPPESPLTPPTGLPGFPTGVVNAFLEQYTITDYPVPAIADDQAWGYKEYTTFPILKIWTLDNDDGVSYEEQYRGLYEMAEVDVTDVCYETIGYGVFTSSGMPKVVFKAIDDYFVIYICAPEFDDRETEDGWYPNAQLNEYMDLMNVSEAPTTPILDLDEPGWKYQNHYYSEHKTWRLFTCYPDYNSPDNSETTGPALEDLYKELLEEDGWEIDATNYDTYGYYATKGWVEIQFFSWDNLFKMWVYKK